MRTQIPGKQILDAGVDTSDIKDGAVTDSKLSTTPVAEGSYTKVSVNPQGRVVAGENPTTLAGYGITDAVSISARNSVITVVDEPDRPAARRLTVSTNQLATTDAGEGATLNIGFADNAVFPGTGSITVPAGTTEQQPAQVGGMLRFNTTTSAIETPMYGEWQRVIVAHDINQDHVVRVAKDPKVGEYSSIAAACAYIAGVNDGQAWLVEIGPGRYVEPEIVVPPYTHVAGFAEYSVVVEPNSSSHPVFTLLGESTVSWLTVEDAPAESQVAFKIHNVGTEWLGVLLHKVSIRNAFIGWDVLATTAPVDVYLEYCDVAPTGGPGSIGLKIQAEAGFPAYVNAENFYVYAGDTNPYHAVDLNGPDVYVNMQSFGLEGNVGEIYGQGLHLEDSASLDVKAGSVFGWDIGVHLANVGAPSKVNLLSVALHDNVTWDLKTEHPGAIGTLTGTARRNKVDAASSPLFTFAYGDIENNGFVQTGDFFLGKTSGTVTNMTPLLVETPPMGLISGGALSSAGGLDVAVAAGTGYLRKDGLVTYVSWPAATVTIDAGATPYIYINKNGLALTSLTEPDGLTNIILGRAGANATVVYSLGSLAIETTNYGNKLEDYLRKAVGTVYVSGSIVTENATTPLAIDVTAGQWMYGTMVRNPGARTAPTMNDIHHTAGNIVFTPRNTIPNDTIDNGTDLVPMTAGYYTKHALYQASEGAFQAYSIGHGSAEYATLDEAITAPLPTPLIPPDSTPRLAAIITQQGNPNIVEIIDIRPMFFRTSGVINGTGGIADHGDLLGLQDDDHQQYLLVTGTRAMIGTLQMGGNNITDVENINGIVIETHADRHLPNGADPLATAAAVSLDANSVNAVGTANSLARSDHTHSLSGLQPANLQLTSLADLETSGILARTGENIVSARTLTGTGGRLIVTDGDGVLGNPTFDLAAISTPGTFQSVTIDAFGRVTAGTTEVPWSSVTEAPTTLGAYGIVDAQPLDADLTALSSMGTLGLYIRTGDGSAVTRSLVQPAAGITITNADGVAGAPTFALANDLGALEALATNGIPVRIGTDTWAVRTLTQPTAGGFTITNPAGTAGNFTFALTGDLLGLENLATFGFAARTATNTWVTRSLSSTSLTITNGDGIAGSPTINLPAIGVAGTYTSVTTDTFGRVTAGSNPTTLSGYGITDAISSTLLGSNNGVATLDASGKLSSTQIPPIAITDTHVVASQAAMLALTAEIGDVAVRSDLNKSFILRTTPASTLASWQELLTPTDAVLSVNGQTGVVVVPNGTVTSVAVQAPVAGFTVSGSPITTSGTLSFALANDLAAVEGLNSLGFAVRTATDTWATRSFVAGSGITLSNTNGVAGNITIGHSIALGDLTNVTLASPAAGQILLYNGTNWTNTTVAPSSASALLSSWTLVSGTRYYADFAHNLGTNNIVITLYDAATNAVVTADEIVLTNTNTVRVTVIGNARSIRAVAVANGNTINTAPLASSTITVAKEGVNVTPAASRLNFVGPNIGVTDGGAGVTNVVFGSRFTFFAASLDTPTSADWAINSLAPTVADPSFSALTVRQFSNTVEQGVGLMLSIPAGATSATFRIKGRGTTAPAAASVVGLRIYSRLIPNNSTIGAWSAAREIGELAIPTNAFYQYGTFTIPLATLGLAAGNLYQIELTRRVAGTTGTNLSNNFLLSEITVEVA